MSNKLFRYAVLVAVMAGALAMTAMAAEEPDVQIGVAKAGATVTIDRVIENGKVLVSVVDAGKNPLLGLSADDFSVTQSGLKAKILSVQPLAESQEVPRHIVLVLDNSSSMDQRNAVEPLLAGVNELLKTIRPIDQVQMVVFNMKQSVNMGGRKLRVETFKSNKPAELQDFATKAYHEGMTGRTVLYEAMLTGLELIGKMPSTEPRFMVVFSDGEDLNSAYKRDDVVKAAQGVGAFNAYAIDFMPGPGKDRFLSKFASENHGQIWKAASVTNLVPIFQSVASTMQYYYVVSYVLPPPTVTPASLTIEEIRTIDASPMLGHIYFANGSSEILPQYVRFAGPGETAGFDPQQLRGTLEKYYQVLNIVGKRLIDHPEATITLVGCNANIGTEKGNKKLSAQRAEAVSNYLQQVWNIAPERMTIEARNLPEMPSVSRLKEGQAENRRVEIRSTVPAILSPIPSIYLATQINTPALTLRTNVASPKAITRWKITAANDGGNLTELAGEGAPASELKIPLPTKDLRTMATGGAISVKMELQDNKGHSVVFSPEPVKVNFIQTKQRLAQKQDLKVQEKYALILFDFDKDTIDARNQDIVNQVAARIRELPQATVDIVGHTDNIGKEAYNIKLSDRRALAVYKLLAAAYGEAPGDRIRYSGVGPNTPLYDNQSPEARSFNRTVTITLEYLSAK
jgi:outer membrane protein OmpA-like peptidoglycan-associated protein/Mg-chelatase subunit ChlD